MEMLYFKKMMKDYNSIIPFSDLEYEEVRTRVVFRKYPKRYILKEAGKSDHCSRYICVGMVGLYDQSSGKPKLTLIMSDTDTAFDEEGFRDNLPTSNVLMTLTDCLLFEFGREEEQELFRVNANFRSLALEVAHRINKRNFEQLEIKKLGMKNGFEKLMLRFRGIEKVLKNRELADYFSWSLRSTERWKNFILKGGSYE